MRLKILSRDHLREVGNTDCGTYNITIIDPDLSYRYRNDRNGDYCGCDKCLESESPSRLKILDSLAKGTLYTYKDNYTAHDMMEVERKYGHENNN